MSIKKNLTDFVERIYHLPPHRYSVEHVQLGAEEFINEPTLISPSLKGKILDTYTYYSDELDDIYSFIAYYKDVVVSIGYVKCKECHNECYSIYLNNLEETLHDELYLINLKEEDLLYANLDVG
ncbi:SAUGI family uracil-DNA glycosylase inhibitor [Macrococcus brunensis]|uniref:SAUGI family uracil-DNA glycosylase inhibitor n=1 Tax=Macrococcus brunensis TaxID=198483 RepID=UPI001EEF9F2B|nr:SAUGI family uracil-DNA glycosylase inhibitor [Macrococcus brunensis]ULG74229.1 hypothetical protein MGG13_00195 [Macrococcus brunensis]